METSQKILIIDNDPNRRGDLEQVLGPAGFETCDAPDGETGLRAAQKHQPDLVLLEPVLPDMDGFEFCRQIREGTDLTGTFVIILTGNLTDEASRVKGLQAGADDYLVRPISNRELVARLRAFMRIQETSKKLWRSELRYRALFEQSNDAIFIIGLDGKFVEVNQRGQDMMGYTLEEFRMHPVWEIMSEVEQSEEMFARHLQGEKIPVYEGTIQKKDGDLLQVEINTELVSDPQGNPLHIQRIMCDITERVQIETALRESEELHRITIQNIQDPVFITDDQGAFTFICGNVEHILGYSVAEIESLGHISALLGDNLFASEDLEIQEFIPNIECEIVDKQGQPRIFWVNVKRVNIQGGTRLYTCHDVTERKQAEQSLRESEERYRLLAKTAQDMIFVVDCQGVVEYGNSTAAKIFGLDPADLVGKSINELFPPENSRKQMNGIRQVIESGKAKYYEGKFEFPENCLWLGTWLAPIRNQDGSINAVMGISRDITEWVVTEQKLRESEERHRLLFENASQGIGYFDLEGRVVAFNREAAHRMDGKPGDFVGRSMVDLFGEKQGAIYHQRIEEAINSLETQVYEDQVVLPLGERWFISSYTRIVNVVGEVVGVQLTSTDITDRKQAEERLQEYSESLEEMITERTQELQDAQEKLISQERLAALGQVASGMAHELRNPLSVIANAVYYLRTTQPEANEKVKEYLDIIESEEQAAERTITDLLDFAKPAQPDPEAFDVHEIIQPVLEESQCSSGIKVSTYFPAQLGRIYADRLHIIQALTNLVCNACQAMPDGGKLSLSADMIPLDIDLEKDSEQNIDRWVQINVEDTGEGISPDHMKKLFEPLFTTRPRSLGMGLPITQKLILANGGRTEVNSQPGKGSRFSVILPAYREKK